jgi:hypothetical protein
MDIAILPGYAPAERYQSMPLFTPSCRKDGVNHNILVSLNNFQIGLLNRTHRDCSGKLRGGIRLDELLPWTWKRLREQIDTAQAAPTFQQRPPEPTGVWLPILNDLLPQANARRLQSTADAYLSDHFQYFALKYFLRSRHGNPDAAPVQFRKQSGDGQD